MEITVKELLGAILIVQLAGFYFSWKLVRGVSGAIDAQHIYLVKLLRNVLDIIQTHELDELEKRMAQLKETTRPAQLTTQPLTTDN